MNARTDDRTQTDAIVVGLAILVLVIGTATGSGYLMLAMAVVAIAAIVIFRWRRLGHRTAVFSVVLSAALAAIVAMGLQLLSGA